ncbi:mitochondrial coenzyme A diphosphatase NUDT8 [Salminus brasiliensis]|uniref:mitochondrial coenzyme A diphosphatase NUDT8 n=1 Tax=Salminus brasiliensis TaxID=930266 RepID=UPI003B83206F
MLRSPQILTSACLLGTHRPLLKTPTFERTLCSIPHSQQFCNVRREKGNQGEHHEPHISEEILHKSYHCPVNTSCSIKPSDLYQNVTNQEGVTTDILSHCLGNTAQHYPSKTTLSEHVMFRNSVPNKCLLLENQTDKYRSSVLRWRTHIHTSIKRQMVYHDVKDTSIDSRISRPYELNRSLWTSRPARWHHCGLLTAQTRGLHCKVPHQATLEDCLSAENEIRCRSHLQSNSALYEKEREKSRAAVLVSLCTVGGEPSFLFTLRSSKLRGRHKGDVSFAGGKRDPLDRNVVDTALREAKEELGITVTENIVWGVLKPLHDVSGMMIAPVLANLGPVEALTLRPNPAEVEEIFTLTVAHVCNPQNQGYTNFRTSGRRIYTLPVFHNSKYRIWGLTAVALDHTLKLIMPV